MTSRERFLNTLLFGQPDRIPFQTGGPRESTLRRWHKEGLPEGVHWNRYLREVIGIEQNPDYGPRPKIFINDRMIPQFEEKVLEERTSTLIVQDWKGNICEISNKFDVTYLRQAKDFVTRKWLKCPVENWADWEEMKKRYEVNNPARVPKNMPEISSQVKGHPYVVTLGWSGPFWQMREWLGFENLCMKFIDDPVLIKDMCSFWTDFIAQLLLKVLPYVEVDFVLISEDMAYKEKAMISPTMTREFLVPVYRSWGDILRQYKVPLYALDSDGYIGELIPIWMECGINVCEPIEVAAGCDLNEFRHNFGKKMAYRGGVDKRAMAKGGRFIQEEMARLEPVIKDGGYIPACDHGIPSDVGWLQFVEFADLLARLTGWK